MKLTAGEYKKQVLHSRNDATYYTFTPKSLTDEKLWVQDVELSILTAKVYKEFGILEGLMKYAPNAEYISLWLKTQEVYYSLMIDDKTDDRFNIFYRNLHKEGGKQLQLIYKAYIYALSNQFNQFGLSMTYKMITEAMENEEISAFRKEPLIWCKAFTSAIIYNPTDPSEIAEMYKDMVDFMYSNELTDSLAKSAILHYQFEMIKPFDSYNGFLGRLLFSMIPSQAGFKGISYLTFSEYLYQNKEDYFRILSSTQATGDYLTLTKYIVRGMLSASERSIDRIMNLEKTIKKDEDKIKNSKDQVKGIDEIYSYFKKYIVTDIMMISKDLGLSYNTASKAIDILIKLKILSIETEQSRHRKFRYTKILSILEEKI